MIQVVDTTGAQQVVGAISGSGTANYLVKWSAALAQQNSRIIDGVAAGDLTIQKTGSTARAIVVPDADIEIQGTAEVISGNWTARNHGSYTVIATATATDPSTPSPGHEFTTLVRNGTVTVGGTAYSTAGSIVTRVYHSGAWNNYVYPHLDAAWTWTATQRINATEALGLNTAVTAGNGLLQLASGTTKASGVAFGTDAFLYRSAAGVVTFVGASGSTQVFVNDPSGASQVWIYADSGQGIIGQVQNKPLSIRTNNLDRIVISNTGQLHMFGGTPVTRSTYGAPTGTATRTTFDTTTVTLPQLAERVKAMIDDFRARGDFA